MPISDLASRRGILNAADLALVRRAFDTACERSLAEKDTIEAEIIAAQIIAEYARGIRSEQELVGAVYAASSQRLAS